MFILNEIDVAKNDKDTAIIKCYYIFFSGMITSALGWGFLADTLGRKQILIAGYLTDAIFVTLAGLAQTYEMLLIAKFFTGFM